MILSNLNQKILIAEKIEYADSWLIRLIGLMFHKPLSAQEGLVIPKCKIIHTFFVKQPLKILVLDIHKKLIEQFTLPPSKVSRYYPKAYYFVELSIQNEKVNLSQKGDEISWRHS